MRNLVDPSDDIAIYTRMAVQISLIAFLGVGFAAQQAHTEVDPVAGGTTPIFFALSISSE